MTNQFEQARLRLPSGLSPEVQDWMARRNVAEGQVGRPIQPQVGAERQAAIRALQAAGTARGGQWAYPEVSQMQAIQDRLKQQFLQTRPDLAATLARPRPGQQQPIGIPGGSWNPLPVSRPIPPAPSTSAIGARGGSQLGGYPAGGAPIDTKLQAIQDFYAGRIDRTLLDEILRGSLTVFPHPEAPPRGQPVGPITSPQPTGWRQLPQGLPTPPWMSALQGGGQLPTWRSPMPIPSAQFWGSMSPTERGGYQGMAEYQGIPWSDQQAQMQRLWPSWQAPQRPSWGASWW